MAIGNRQYSHRLGINFLRVSFSFGSVLFDLGLILFGETLQHQLRHIRVSNVMEEGSVDHQACRDSSMDGRLDNLNGVEVRHDEHARNLAIGHR